MYLAYFANDKLKVGTAASYRRYERLLEQGALYSIFLAKVPNGRLARRIESEVSRLGVTTRVNTSYKINNFVIDKTQEEIEQMLMDEYQTILEKISELLEESRQLNLFGGMDEPERKEYDRVPKPENVDGDIKAVVGNLMLIKKENKYSVVNMKNLEGWIVDFKRRELGDKRENGSFEKSDR